MHCQAALAIEPHALHVLPQGQRSKRDADAATGIDDCVDVGGHGR
jgi:hypothetical protein